MIYIHTAAAVAFVFLAVAVPMLLCGRQMRREREVLLDASSVVQRKAVTR